MFKSEENNGESYFLVDKTTLNSNKIVKCYSFKHVEEIIDVYNFLNCKNKL